jgi:hypothetical protein
MPFNEPSFCHLLAQGRLSFAEMSQQLAMAELENRGKTPSFVISPSTQAVIYQRIPDLLPGFAGESTCIHWITPATVLTLGYWLAGLSRFEPGIYREALLKDTATLLHHLPFILDGARISNAVLTVQNMKDSEGVRAILKVIKVQLINSTLARLFLKPKVLCTILYGLKNQPDSAKFRAILHALLPHLAAYIAAGIGWSSKEISDALYSLSVMPDLPEVAAIYLQLQPQVIALSMTLDTKALGYAFDLLTNLPESIDMAEQSKIFLLALQARIHDEQNLLDLQTLAYILNSLQRFPPSIEVDLTLSGVKKHLDKNAQIGQWLDIQALYKALYGLQYLALSTEAYEIVLALELHMANIKFPQIMPEAGYWLAEAIYIFRRYSEHPKGRVVANAFLHTAARVFGLALDTDRLSQADTRMAEILRLAPYLTSTARGEQQLDLRFCSHFLGLALCQYVFTYRQKTTALTIIFPDESTFKSQSRKRQKVISFLQKLLADEICYWEFAQVTLPPIKNGSTGKREKTQLAERLRQKILHAKKRKHNHDATTRS